MELMTTILCTRVFALRLLERGEKDKKHNHNKSELMTTILCKSLLKKHFQSLRVRIYSLMLDSINWYNPPLSLLILLSYRDGGMPRCYRALWKLKLKKGNLIAFYKKK